MEFDLGVLRTSARTDEMGYLQVNGGVGCLCPCRCTSGLSYSLASIYQAVRLLRVLPTANGIGIDSEMVHTSAPIAVALEPGPWPRRVLVLVLRVSGRSVLNKAHPGQPMKVAKRSLLMGYTTRVGSQRTGVDSRPTTRKSSRPSTQ